MRKNNDNSQQKIQELQSENKQLKNKIADIKSNYVSHDEDFENIKKLLNELNNKTEINQKKIEENEKKFDMCCSSNRQKDENKLEQNEDEIIKLSNCIKEIKDNSDTYKLLIDEIKCNNDLLIKVNKDIC